jgi:hypothetical protein
MRPSHKKIRQAHLCLQLLPQLQQPCLLLSQQPLGARRQKVGRGVRRHGGGRERVRRRGQRLKGDGSCRSRSGEAKQRSPRVLLLRRGYKSAGAALYIHLVLLVSPDER